MARFENSNKGNSSMPSRGLLDIKKIIIGYEFIVKAYDVMRSAGEKNAEAVALFAGKTANENFHVDKVIIPEQISYIIDQGCLYFVDSEELYKINKWLFENKRTVIAQIHSHPNEAFHSDTDDNNAIVTTIGGFSIVVPRFAKETIKIERWAVYRLSSTNTWVKLTYLEITDLIQIIGD